MVARQASSVNEMDCTIDDTNTDKTNTSYASSSQLPNETQVLPGPVGPVLVTDESEQLFSLSNVNMSNADFLQHMTNIIGNKPNQPRIKQFPVATISGDKRCFHQEWFDKWQWLHWRSEKEDALCHLCRMAHKLGLLSFSKNTDLAFIMTGFNNWKKSVKQV
jgi:hypothetical protein